MKTGILALTAMASLLLTGCLHVISSDARRQVEPSATLAVATEAPGTTLLLGGLVVKGTRLTDDLSLEVLRFHLDLRGYPYSVSDTGEFFLIEGETDLPETDLFYGRFVTLVGRSTGEKLIPGLDGRPDRHLPVFDIVELYLWDTPFLWGVQGHPNLYAPVYRSPRNENPLHANPYDASYAPYPYTPYWYRASAAN